MAITATKTPSHRHVGVVLSPEDYATLQEVARDMERATNSDTLRALIRNAARTIAREGVKGRRAARRAAK